MKVEVNSKAVSTSELAAIIARAGNGKRSKRLWLAGTLLAVAVALALIVTVAGLGDAPAGPRYVTEPVTNGNITLTVTATGNLAPTNEVTVGSELSGRVLQVDVDSNDRVVSGQTLAVLDTRSLENELKAKAAALESAVAAVSQARATLKEAEAALARQQTLKKLSEGRVPSLAVMESALAAAARAEADLQSALAKEGEARAQVELKEADLEKAVIRSPVDGVVLSRSIEVGQTVAASFSTPELFVIAEDLSRMKLEVAVAEADIGRVATGQKAAFRVDAWPDRQYQASVTKVSYGSAITDNVVTYTTELAVSNEDLSLRPGMTATADLEVANRQGVLLVPVAALRFNPQNDAPAAAAEAADRSFIDSLMPRPPRQKERTRTGESTQDSSAGARVWLLRNGEPVAVDVTTGINDGRRVEVSARDLAAGDLVIIREVST